MRHIWIFAALTCFPFTLLAQSAIPPETILPVSLDTGLNAAKAHAGQAIRATVMQDIPGTAIRRHARVLGHIVRVSAPASGQIEMEVRFDVVSQHGKRISIQTDLRALASFFAVQQAQIPEEMGSRGLTPATWDTQQIGGDQVYRAGGAVMSGLTAVGVVTPWGALDRPRSRPGLPCRGVAGDNDRPQAMWLFSSDACGVYGFTSIRIAHAGRSAPRGTIVLTSTAGKLKIGSGAGLLLRIL